MNSRDVFFAGGMDILYRFVGYPSLKVMSCSNSTEIVFRFELMMLWCNHVHLHILQIASNWFSLSIMIALRGNQVFSIGGIHNFYRFVGYLTV